MIVLDDHSQELNLGLLEGTLCSFKIEIVLMEGFKDFADDLLMMS
jgi:hypothetical protein